jgi:hypothetical protein
MKPVLLCYFFLLSIQAQAQEIFNVNALHVKTYARLEKKDSVFQNNLKTYKYSDYKPFNKILLDIILSEKPKKYNAFSNREMGMYSPLRDTMSNEEIRNRLGYGVFRRLVSDENGNELYTEVLETVITDTSSITFILGFEETWHFDFNTLSFEKEVDNIEIVREYFDEESQKVRTNVIAVIPNNKATDSKLEKIAQISYEHSLLMPIDWVKNDNDTNFVKQMKNAGLLNYSLILENEAFNSYTRIQFFKELSENLLNGKLKVLDFFSRKPLNRKEIIEKLKDCNVFIPEESSENELEFGAIDPEDIDALIFTEDWYFNSKTFSFKKEIKEISLVKYSYGSTDKYFSLPQRNIIFTVLCE